MKIRSKAPLRLGLAGGGTDVSPYCDMFGGVVLNATINLYAYCTIEPLTENKVEFIASDLGESFSGEANKILPIDGKLSLLKGVYNHILKELGEIPPCRISTFSEAPAGSGLGSSSTMVVAILKAFTEWLDLPLGDYEIAKKAYLIERKELALSGGKQDQYAATFGGFNFIEFAKDDHVIVNPLRVKRWITDELEASIVLYFTGVSRESAHIIETQKKNAASGDTRSIEGMHELKENAYAMKNFLLKGDIASFAKLLAQGWESKKKMADSITNPVIQEAFDLALSAGAISGKVSGAGGGGFIMFMADPANRVAVVNALKQLPGTISTVQFTEGGTHGWKIFSE